MATASVDNVKDGLQTLLNWANSQGWTSCTGTVVESDLTPLSTAISNLESCPGLSCQGTLTASDISDMATKSWANSQGWTTCTGTLTASDLDDYATKTCVKTIVNGIFSLSGNVLTITSA